MVVGTIFLKFHRKRLGIIVWIGHFKVRRSVDRLLFGLFKRIFPVEVINVVVL